MRGRDRRVHCRGGEGGFLLVNLLAHLLAHHRLVHRLSMYHRARAGAWTTALPPPLLVHKLKPIHFEPCIDYLLSTWLFRSGLLGFDTLGPRFDDLYDGLRERLKRRRLWDRRWFSLGNWPSSHRRGGHQEPKECLLRRACTRLRELPPLGCILGFMPFTTNETRHGAGENT